MGCWGAESKESRSLTAPLWNRTTGSPPATQWTLQTSDDTWGEFIDRRGNEDPDWTDVAQVVIAATSLKNNVQMELIQAATNKSSSHNCTIHH